MLVAATVVFDSASAAPKQAFWDRLKTFRFRCYRETLNGQIRLNTLILMSPRDGS